MTLSALAVKEAGLKRVFWVGGASGLEVRPGVRVVYDPDLSAAIRPGSLATINALEQLKKEPELDWSYLAPSANINQDNGLDIFASATTNS